MANCDSILKKYDNMMRLDEDKREILKEKRDSLDDIIKKYFQEKELKTPSFKGQGSFTMKTIINPKNEETSYDIDYGVYVNIKDVKKDDDEIVKSYIAQGWVKQAIDKYLSENNDDEIIGVSHKNKCVRIKCEREITKKDPETGNNVKAKEKYHIDLPVYFIDEEKYYLAVKDQGDGDNCGWEESNPRAIIDWFWGELADENKGEQFRRVIRYFKNWSELQNWTSKKPTGLLWTVLTSNNFNIAEFNDDIALIETAKSIKNSLDTLVFKPELENPIYEEEDLLENYTTKAIENIVEKLNKLVEKGEAAIQSDDTDEAYKSWGYIFPDAEDFIDNSASEASINTKYLQTSAPAILGNDERSA